MFVTKEKLVKIFFIIISICIILGIGFLITGKVPEELFAEKKENKEGIDNSFIFPIPQYDPTLNYDSNGKNIVKYHDTIDEIQKKNDLKDGKLGGTVKVLNPSGQMIELDSSGVEFDNKWLKNTSALPIYYQPGTFKFGAHNFVPNYEDSVYLSRTTGLSSSGIAYNTSSKKAGFCNQPSTISSETEAKCGKLDQETCASVSCCVLLGGSKCVAGNENGPTMKSNYTDPFVINKDVYYYQGKCYGNCV